MPLRHVKKPNWVPTIVLLLASSWAWASADLEVGSAFRSYPLSGVMEIKSGYGVVFYGTEGGPFSGYGRIALEGATAGTYNSGLAKVELFPLGILGARAGGETAQNDSEYRAYDCDLYFCEGRFYRTFFEAELTLGAGPVFLQGRWRRERWSEKEPSDGDFIDPTSGLVMDATGESQSVYHGVAGLKLGSSFSILGGLRYAEGETGLSRFTFGLLRYRSGGWSAGVGGGVFESELKARGGSALLFLNYEIWPSVALR